MLPTWIARVVRAVVPEEFADDLVLDLSEGYARRSRRAGRWLLGELLRTPWLGLHRQARRMRGRSVRRAFRPRAGGGLGSPWPGLAVATRSLVKRPQHAGVAVLALAASIGSATLAFSVLEGVLLRPLPYEGGERVYRIFATNEAWRTAEQEVLRLGWDRLDLTEDMLRALRGRIPEAEALGAYTKAQLRLDDALDPVQIPGAYVLPDIFETLPISPLLGRLPRPDELESGARVVVLSERLWTSRYGRAADVVGREVRLGGTPYEVVGVLPAVFAVPDEATRWWAPLPVDFAGGQTDHAVFVGLVRLRAGAEPQAAVDAVARVREGLAEEDPMYAQMGVRLQRLSELVVSGVRQAIVLLFLAAGAVVLIGCVNLANLMVAGSSRRRGELAMRAALGASRWDLIWALLSEAAVICALGGALGVLLAHQLLVPFVALLSRGANVFPRADEVAVNGTVLVFSAAVTMLTALAAGLLPALPASRLAPWETLRKGRGRGGGAATRRTQRTLLLVEAALATSLLAVAGLLTRSALHLSRVDPGFDPRPVAFLRVDTPGERYDTLEVQALGTELEALMGALPDVAVAARASALPGLGNADGKLVWRPEQSSEEAQLVWSALVSPSYFEALSIPLLAGRGFSDADGRQDAQVAVVSEIFAARFFPGRNAVGQTILISTDTRLEGGRVVAAGQKELAVVGVTADVRQLAVMMEPDPVLYLPIAQASGSNPILILRTGGPPEGVLAAARAQVREVDPALLVSEANVLRGAMATLTAPLGVRTTLIAVLAALSAFLTAVGVYGVVAYVVSDQRHEIGVRIALGARNRGETTRVVGRALRPVLFGAGLGLLGAWGVGGLVESALFGVGTLDLPTYAAVLALVAGVAGVSAWVPARRAAAVDPVRVLREED